MKIRSTFAVLAVACLAQITLAQSTAMTYQGELKQGTTLANGPHDLRFRLFDAASGGAAIGSQVCVDNVSVAGGRFTTTIDFGQQFASIAPRYLEIEVRPDTGLSCANTTGYTVLSPRQLLTATPRASAATTANSLAIPNGSSVLVNLTNTGNVGIGTNAPTSQLHVNGVQDAFKISAFQPLITLLDTSASNIRVQLQNSLGRYYVTSESFLNGTNPGGFTMVNPQGWLGIGTHNPGGPLEVASGNQSYFRIDPINGDIHINGGTDGAGGIINTGGAGGATAILSNHGARLHVMNTGNVGIGTSTPTAKLEVNGGIKIAPAMRWRAVHGAAFTPEYLDSASFGTQGGLQIVEQFGTGNSGTIGDISSVGTASYFAALELPDGAVLEDLIVDARDQHASQDIVLSIGKTNLTTGFCTEVAQTFTSGNTTTIQHAAHGPIGEVINNNANVYFLRVKMATSGSNIHWLLAARVKYSVTAPLP